MHCVITTSGFEKAAKRIGLDDDAINTIISSIAADPAQGDLIQGTGGARKIRVPAKGKGKRGGARMVSYYAAEDVPVFLLDIYAKGERIAPSKAERNELKTILGGIADDYRRTMSQRVSELAKTGTDQ